MAKTTPIASDDATARSVAHSAFYDHAGITLWQGDCRETLAMLPDQSVQTCVTSPPYFGLRDYGTAEWDGGDAACDHTQQRAPRAERARGKLVGSTTGIDAADDAALAYRDTCGKCGARRIDRQIGLEPSPAAYVAEMVSVFREVRRVLRDDGTVFLNLGDSYFGGGGYYPDAASNQRGSLQAGGNRAGQRNIKGRARGSGASAYGSVGTASPDYPASDSTSQSPDGGRTDAWWNRIPHSDLRHALEQVAEPLRQIRARMAELRDRLPSSDCSRPILTGQSSSAILDQAKTASLAIERLRASLASTPIESSPPPPAGFHLSDMLSACLSSLHSFAGCVQRCARTWDASADVPHGTVDTASLCEELAHHIRCTDGYCSLVLSWLNPPYVEPHCTTSALKPKDLLGIPWRVAFALQEDGWWLRSDIIWAKPNPMPESVTDRPTRSHEYIFLLSKSARYWYDAYAIAEPAANPFDLGLLRGRSFVDGANVAWHAPSIVKRQEAGVDSRTAGSANRNKRDVWTITTAPYPNAHFATFPPKLIEPCILAGAPAGGVVLDPFAGAGTTLLVAKNLNRQAVGIELSPDYCGLIVDRLQQDVLPLAVLHDD